MMIAARNAFLMGAKLPYDAEVEYLESTGTQCIDTEVYGDAVWDADVICTDNRSAVLLTSTIGALPGSWVGSYSNAVYWSVGSRIYSSIAKTVRTNIHATFNSMGVTASFNSDTKTNAQTITQGEWRVFADRNHNGSRVDFPAYAKLFRLECRQNSTLVRDYIPVRVGSGTSAVGYMYDRVSGELFGNAGTGAFIIGPDK